MMINMKKILSLLFLFSVYAAHSQENAEWKIELNHKIIFSANKENEPENIDSIKFSDLTPNHYFTIFYHEAIEKKRNEWKRVIGIYNEEDKELLRKYTSKLKLNTAQVKKWLLQNKKFKIYTWSIPKDPTEAARVRVRRVHLCTIVLI